MRRMLQTPRNSLWIFPRKACVAYAAMRAPRRGLGRASMIDVSSLLKNAISAAIFVGIGLVVFAIAFLIIVKVTPFSIRKEIEEDQNPALAIVIGSVILGLAWIIAAAIHG